MSAFQSTSDYYNLSAEARYELAASMEMLSISQDEPVRNLGSNSSSSSSLSPSMSRSISYKLDLSSLGTSAGMPLSSNPQQNNSSDPASWGYFVDSVNRRWTQRSTTGLFILLYCMTSMSTSSQHQTVTCSPPIWNLYSPSTDELCIALAPASSTPESFIVRTQSKPVMLKNKRTTDNCHHCLLDRNCSTKYNNWDHDKDMLRNKTRSAVNSSAGLLWMKIHSSQQLFVLRRARLRRSHSLYVLTEYKASEQPLGIVALSDDLGGAVFAHNSRLSVSSSIDTYLLNVLEPPLVYLSICSRRKQQLVQIAPTKGL